MRRAEQLDARQGGAPGARRRRRGVLQARVPRGSGHRGAADGGGEGGVRGGREGDERRGAGVSARAERGSDVVVRRLRGDQRRGGRGDGAVPGDVHLGRRDRGRVRARGAGDFEEEEEGRVHRAAGRGGLRDAADGVPRAARVRAGAATQRRGAVERADGQRGDGEEGDPRGRDERSHPRQHLSQVHAVQLRRLRAQRTDDRRRRGAAEPRGLRQAGGREEGSEA